jgi:hypothetical protein
MKCFCCDCTKQGDQIGQIFSFWATFYFGQFLDNYKSSRQHVVAAFSTVHELYLSINFDEMGWAMFWAIFFTNPSGHPGAKHHLEALQTNFGNKLLQKIGLGS